MHCCGHYLSLRGHFLSINFFVYICVDILKREYRLTPLHTYLHTHTHTRAHATKEKVTVIAESKMHGKCHSTLKSKTVVL